MYFKSEKDFQEFIELCNQNMVPVIWHWVSNIRGNGIRWMVYSLAHNKQKWDEAINYLSTKCIDSPKYEKGNDNI